MAGTTAHDDGLPCLEVGAWAEEKYRLVQLYDELFSTAMKNKWETRVYIDLYAGPGFSRIRGTKRLLTGSPLLALAVPDQFDQYIFCETDPSHLGALERRVGRLFPSAKVQYVLGDCNDRVDEVSASIPAYSKNQRVLSFCFVDPFDLSPKFATVRKLSFYYMDFLFLLALHMDANRNLPHYLAPDNSKVEDFLGLSDWRERWKIAEAQGTRFPRYLAEEYSKQMENLGYLPIPWHKMRQVRSDDKNLPLYRLALFSRHRLAYELWDQVLKYSSDQTEFFES
jgi:three-Cys-motif partner protein